MGPGTQHLHIPRGIAFCCPSAASLVGARHRCVDRKEGRMGDWKEGSGGEECEMGESVVGKMLERGGWVDE